MKFYDLKRRKQISLFAAAGGNNAKKVETSINEEQVSMVTNNHDNSASFLCLLGATSNISASIGHTEKHVSSPRQIFSKTKNTGNNNKTLSLKIVNHGNGIFGSSPPPPLSSLTASDSLSSGRSSSSDSESGKDKFSIYFFEWQFIDIHSKNVNSVL